MTGDVNNIPETWLSALGGADASGWLSAFAEAPEKAVAALLWDTFYFGPLNASERGQLLTGWLELLGNRDSFAERLDAEFTRWVEKNWGNFEPRAESLTSAWSCLCSVVEFSAKLHAESRLTNCATALRARFPDRQNFLGSFSSAPAADPLGLYLAVLAEFQGESRSLATFWHKMCFLPDSVPFYHARYAMLGLRRLKAVNSLEDGTLRAEVVLGLLHLARSFDRLERERGLDAAIARETFSRVAARTAAAYPNSGRWLEHGEAEFHRLPKRAQGWVRQAIPIFNQAAERGGLQPGSRRQHSPKLLEPNPSWFARKKALLDRLRKGNLDCLPEVMQLLDEERLYAESTGDTSSVVRTLCHFATRTQSFSPKLALVWAKEAHELAPHDPFTWSTLRTILLNQGKVDEALRFAWVAWKRFPQNDVIRNDLADALKSARRYGEAEAVYLQTIEHFPNDPVARNGLGDVLRVLKRYDEAVAVYRETVERFLDNVVESTIARNGLAGTLRSAGRWRQAEAEYRHSIEAGRADSTTFVDLATVILRKGEASRAEALSLLKQALALNPYHRQARKLRQQLSPDAEANLQDLAVRWEQAAEALLQSSARAAVEDDEPSASHPEVTTEPSDDELQSPEEQPITPEAGAAPPQVEEIETRPPSRSSGEPGVEEATPARQDKAASSVEAGRPESAPQKRPQVKSDDSESRIKEAGPRKNFKAPAASHTGGKSSSETTVGSTEPERPSQVTRQEEKPNPAPVVAEDEGRELRPQPKPYDSILITALVAEAYFYRTVIRDAELKTSKSWRRKAAELLDTAERLAPNDAQVLAEKIALSVGRGDNSDAYEKLTAQISSRPASAPLLVLKARLDRDRARRESRPLNESNLDELCISPQRLRSLNPTLAPLFHFQRGLAALALLDGQTRLNTAAEAFTKFRRVLARRADEERKDREATHNRIALHFHEWLQLQVDNRVFPGATGKETISVQPGEIRLLEGIWAQRHSALEEVEDVFIDRVSFGTL